MVATIPTTDTIKTRIAAKLDRLANWRQEELDTNAVCEQQRIAVLAPIQAQIDALMAPLKSQLDKIEAERGAALSMLRIGIKKMEDEIDADVLAAGGNSEDGKFSVSGRELMAIYYSGKTSVDSKGLEGYAVAHPEVRVFIHKGKPYTSIQATRSKKNGD